MNWDCNADAPQASDGNSAWENVSFLECSSAPMGVPMAMDDAAACHGEDSSEQMTPDDENSCKKGSQEGIVNIVIHRLY